MTGAQHIAIQLPWQSQTAAASCQPVPKAATGGFGFKELTLGDEKSHHCNTTVVWGSPNAPVLTVRSSCTKALIGSAGAPPSGT